MVRIGPDYNAYCKHIYRYHYQWAFQKQVTFFVQDKEEPVVSLWIKCQPNHNFGIPRRKAGIFT